jgi:hypothetical protein
VSNGGYHDLGAAKIMAPIGKRSPGLSSERSRKKSEPNPVVPEPAKSDHPEICP